MAQRPSTQVKKSPQVSEGELVNCNSDNGHLINQVIVQILIEQNHPEKIKELMASELKYNKERLEILREHAEKHPDKIEERVGKKFRRSQYLYLMAILIPLNIMIYYTPVAIALSLCVIDMIIICGLVFNGRDRDNDADMLLKVIEGIMKRIS